MLRPGVPGSLVGAVARRAHLLTTISDTAASQAEVPGSRSRVRVRSLLFFGFAFAVMADPVSSVAYAIEAALRALHGHLDLLFVTMALVIGVIALVTTNYWFLVRRFPRGGGDA